MPLTPASEQLKDLLIQHRVYLERFGNTTAKDTIKLLNEARQSIYKMIGGADFLEGGLVSPSQKKRLTAVLAEIDKLLISAYKKVYTAHLLEGIRDLSKSEGLFIQSATQDSLPVVINTITPAPVLLATLANNKVMGKSLETWMSSLAKTESAKVQSAVKNGMVSGMPIRDIVKTAQATSTLSNQHLYTVVRTSVMQASSDSMQAFYKANKDIIKRVVYIATLDGRTTPLCSALDGQIYELGKEKNIPPSHYNCRSILVPIFEKFIGNRPSKPTTTDLLKKEYAKINPEQPYQQWASKRTRELISQVPASTTYEEWLKNQRKEFQISVLGSKKAELFRSGKLSLKDFVDFNSGQSYSLKTLEKQHPTLFKELK
jgi:SPP1 gp7 family putative phage head morphogenesis protein